MLTKKELKEKIDDLDKDVSKLFHAARMRRGELPKGSLFASYDCIDVSDAVQLILDHLGLKIETNPDVNQYRLVKKPKDAKK